MRRPRSTALAALAVVGLLLAGCGSDDGDDVSVDSAPASEAESTTESTVAAEPSEPDATATEPADEGDEGGSDGSDSETTATSAPGGDGTTDGTDAEGGDTGSGSGGDLSPGDPCSLEEGVADCIDPDGDGQGTYLTGGASCMAGAVEPSVCEDLDGDGAAGYPDEYDGLPTCAADVPPPCNNPEDPDAEDQG